MQRNGLQRIKECEYMGIDGNHKSGVKLKIGGKKAWDQLISLVGMYVNLTT